MASLWRLETSLLPLSQLPGYIVCTIPAQTPVDPDISAVDLSEAQVELAIVDKVVIDRCADVWLSRTRAPAAGVSLNPFRKRKRLGDRSGLGGGWVGSVGGGTWICQRGGNGGVGGVLIIVTGNFSRVDVLECHLPADVRRKWRSNV